jgi:hypothetical protein
MCTRLIIVASIGGRPVYGTARTVMQQLGDIVRDAVQKPRAASWGPRGSIMAHFMTKFLMGSIWECERLRRDPGGQAAIEHPSPGAAPATTASSRSSIR